MNQSNIKRVRVIQLREDQMSSIQLAELTMLPFRNSRSLKLNLIMGASVLRWYSNISKIEKRLKGNIDRAGNRNIINKNIK